MYMARKPKNIHACLFNTLGDDNRLKILKYLSSGEKCVCHINKKLKMPQNLVSHHLSVMKKCGCVKCRKKGKWSHYSINEKFIKELNGFLATLYHKN